MRSAESRIREDESVYEFPVCYSRYSYSTLFYMVFTSPYVRSSGGFGGWMSGDA